MRILIISLTSIVFFLASCGPEVPTEAQLRAKIAGTYCSEDHKLVLTETTYKNMKTFLGPISNTPMRESCKGTYSLVYEKDSWIIRFAKDDNPKGIQNCKTEYALWTKEGGYLIGEEKVVMKDLFDNKELTKEACEEEL